MSPMRIRSDVDLQRLLDSVIEDTQSASFHWRLYKDLRAAIPEFGRELNEARAFWSLTLAAHSHAALFRLGRLYDPHGGLSLVSLLEIIEKNVQHFDEASFRERLKGNPFVDSLAQGARRPDPATLATDRQAVIEPEPLVAKLLAVRNKVLAHRDPRVVIGTSPDPSSGLAAVDVDALLGRASEIVNRYSILFRAGSYTMRLVGDDDYQSVLKAVREYLASVEQRIAVEAGGGETL